MRSQIEQIQMTLDAIVQKLEKKKTTEHPENSKTNQFPMEVFPIDSIEKLKQVEDQLSKDESVKASLVGKTMQYSLICCIQ